MALGTFFAIAILLALVFTPIGRGLLSLLLILLVIAVIIGGIMVAVQINREQQWQKQAATCFHYYQQHNEAEYEQCLDAAKRGEERSR
jgi:hypothetical protein